MLEGRQVVGEGAGDGFRRERAALFDAKPFRPGTPSPVKPVALTASRPGGSLSLSTTGVPALPPSTCASPRLEAVAMIIPSPLMPAPSPVSSSPSSGRRVGAGRDSSFQWGAAPNAGVAATSSANDAASAAETTRLAPPHAAGPGHGCSSPARFLRLRGVALVGGTFTGLAFRALLVPVTARLQRSGQLLCARQGGRRGRPGRLGSADCAAGDDVPGHRDARARRRREGRRWRCGALARCRRRFFAGRGRRRRRRRARRGGFADVGVVDVEVGVEVLREQLAAVTKKASLPPSLASMKADSCDRSSPRRSGRGSRRRSRSCRLRGGSYS